jgi:hypothetical protein
MGRPWRTDLQTAGTVSLQPDAPFAVLTDQPS